MQEGPLPGDASPGQRPFVCSRDWTRTSNPSGYPLAQVIGLFGEDLEAVAA